MDFGTVRKKLDGGAYANLEQFEVGLRMHFMQIYRQTYNSVTRVADVQTLIL
jgi:hypothetical protein